MYVVAYRVWTRDKEGEWYTRAQAKEFEHLNEATEYMEKISKDDRYEDINLTEEK